MEDNTETYVETLNRYLDALPSNRILITNSIPTVGQARGRVVIIDRFPGSIGAIEWDASFLDIQDDYQVPTLFHRDDKWHKVRDQLNKAKNDPSDAKLYINFCSGTSAGAYPDDVASYVNWRVQDHIESAGPHYRWGVVIFDFPRVGYLEAVFYSSFYPQLLADNIEYNPDPEPTK